MEEGAERTRHEIRRQNFRNLYCRTGIWWYAKCKVYGLRDIAPWPCGGSLFSYHVKLLCVDFEQSSLSRLMLTVFKSTGYPLPWINHPWMPGQASQSAGSVFVWVWGREPTVTLLNRVAKNLCQRHCCGCFSLVMCPPKRRLRYDWMIFRCCWPLIIRNAGIDCWSQ